MTGLILGIFVLLVITFIVIKSWLHKKAIKKEQLARNSESRRYYFYIFGNTFDYNCHTTLISWIHHKFINNNIYSYKQIIVLAFPDPSQPLYPFFDGRFYRNKSSSRRRLAVVHLVKCSKVYSGSHLELRCFTSPELRLLTLKKAGQ